MNKISFLPLVAALVATASLAQVERRTQVELQADKQALPALQKTVSGELAAHLGRIAKNSDAKRVSNAVRVARDACAAGAANAPLAFYEVDPMSNVQYLPDAYPLDGTANSAVRISAAGDEYEPGSFVIYPFKDFGKVKLSLSPFKTDDGAVYPADKLDLKVVKVWYQDLNAWYTYFGTTGLKLVPELLLNDEDLIKVDTEDAQNYARLTEKDGRVHYFWLTPPMEFESRYDEYFRPGTPFNSMQENFCDASTIQPVTLSEGSFKQFFLTARVLKDQKPGLYRGAVALTGVADNKKIAAIPVTIRVFPFTLPEPCRYADCDKKMPVMINHYITHHFIMRENGGDWELADKQYAAILNNFFEHNQRYLFMRDDGDVRSWNNRNIFDNFKKAGINKDRIFGLGGLYGAGNEAERYFDARMKYKWLKENYGADCEYYLIHGDEPSPAWVAQQRPVLSIYAKAGFKVELAGSDALYRRGADIFDYVHRAGFPEDAKGAELWTKMGADVSWYACQHVGPENPAFNRLQYGFIQYLSGYTTVNNYAHHVGGYNDRASGFRPMIFAYSQYSGLIDTLQWEGFREAIDDVRYATLMLRLAKEAEASADFDTRSAGRQARLLLARLTPETVDATSLRLEVIRHIIRLKEAQGK